VVIVLLLVDLDEPRDEAAPVVGRCDDGDEHWCFLVDGVSGSNLEAVKLDRYIVRRISATACI
jgi:hypothetical protein